MITKVVFRKWSDGDVIALFPEIPATLPGCDCLSYMHVGQHGAADPQLVVQATLPATPKEYADLKAELERIGYDLEVRQRIGRNALDVRRTVIGIRKTSTV